VASGLAGAIAGPSVLAANGRIRLGIIGPGDRGTQSVREPLACPNTELAGVADIYQAPGRRPRPRTRRQMHCERFVAALDAGKHVYREKTMAFSVEHARRMRAACERAGRRTVQIGHQGCSSGQVWAAVNFLKTGVGKIAAVHAHMYRST